MTEEERPESQGRCGPAAVHRVRKLVSGGMDAKLHQRRSLLAQAKTEGDPEFQVTGEDAFRSEREMLLAAVAGLREAAEAAMRRAEAAEAACFAPVKQVIEAHLKEYKEHMASEFRHALQREVSEATAELRATARELRLLCCSPLVSTERREAADVKDLLPCGPERGSSARPEPKAGDVAQLSRSDSLHQTLPSLRLANEIHEAKASSGRLHGSASPGLALASGREPKTRTRAQSLQEDASVSHETGSFDEEEVEVRRRRSVRDVVSHFEKTQIANRGSPVGLASSSSLDRLVPASLLEEDKSISYERGHAAADASHEAGRCTLPGLTERASREELDANHPSFVRRRSI